MSRRRIPPDHSFTVSALNSDGYGQASYQANEQAKPRAVLIKGGLPGEQVTARVLKRKGASYFAQALTVADPNPKRVASPCQHFPRCGGCVLQHFDYPEQLKHKQQLLLAELERVGVSYECLAPPAFASKLHYRSKARLGARLLGGDMLLGFRESFSSRVLRMQQCLVLQPRLAALVAELRECLASLSIAHAVPQVELAAGDTPGKHQAQVVIRHLEPLLTQDREHLQAFATKVGCTVALQSGGPDTVRLLESSAAPDALAQHKATSQLPLLSYGLPQFGLQLEFGALDFTQVNLDLNQRLVSDVVAAVAPTPGQPVMDLFCGIGNFSLALARAGARVVGYEGSQLAIIRAISNGQLNGLAANTSFAPLDLYGPSAAQLFANEPHAGGTATGQSMLARPVEALVIDPPRSGAGPNLAAWLQSPDFRHVRRIAYVSCNPVSFADDAAILRSAGFNLSKVGIYDMFPQTAHVETLGLFERG